MFACSLDFFPACRRTGKGIPTYIVEICRNQSQRLAAISIRTSLIQLCTVIRLNDSFPPLAYAPEPNSKVLQEKNRQSLRNSNSWEESQLDQGQSVEYCVVPAFLGCLLSQKADQWLYVHVERQGKLVRIHKSICRTNTDYSALHALTNGVVLESYLLCDSLDSGRVWHKCFLTPVSAEPAWRERIRGYRWWRQPWGLHVWKGRCRILLSLQVWWAIGSSWKVWQLFMVWN